MFALDGLMLLLFPRPPFLLFEVSEHAGSSNGTTAFYQESQFAEDLREISPHFESTPFKALSYTQSLLEFQCAGVIPFRSGVQSRKVPLYWDCSALPRKKVVLRPFSRIALSGKGRETKSVRDYFVPIPFGQCQLTR